MKQLKVKLLATGAKAPTRAFNSEGYDVYSMGDFILSVGETKIIPLGFAAELPPNHVAVAFDRGSLGSKAVHTFHQLRVDDEIVNAGTCRAVHDWLRHI